MVHLRRALLLFAIVLGLAAIAASVSRPREEREPEPPPATTAPEPPTVEPGPNAPASAGQAELFFDAAAPRAHGMQSGAAATVYVAVPQPGQVEIPDLGLDTSATPLTAARFEILTSQTGRFPITFAAAGGGAEPQRAGTLVVRE
jgi:hypothetical protein